MTIPLLAICCLLSTLSALFSMSESALTAVDVLRLRVDALGKVVHTNNASSKSDNTKGGSSDDNSNVNNKSSNNPSQTPPQTKKSCMTLTKKRALRVMRLLRKKTFVINTLLVANDLVNLALSSIFTLVAMKLFGAASLPVASGAATVVLLIFGEITPKTFVIRNPTLAAYRLSLFASVVVAILSPLAFLYTSLANAFLSVLSPKKKEKALFSKDDIRAYLSKSPLVKNAFDFTTLSAHDIMTPRGQVVLFSERTTLADILSTARETLYSYYPVYRDNIDDIIGILYLKDLLPIIDTLRPSDTIPRSLLRKALFVPGTNKMTDIIALLENEKQSFAIVSDEYGGLDGILTKRNIASRVFNLAKKETTLVPGSTLLSDVCDMLGITFKNPVSSTLGGYITETLGDFPKVGDSVTTPTHRFTVIKATSHTVLMVRLEKLTGKPEGRDE